MQFTSLLKNKEEAKISFENLIEGREKKPKEELHNLTEKEVSENSRNGMAESIIADPFGEIPGNLSGRGGMRTVDLDEDFGSLQAAQAEYSLAAIRAQAKMDVTQNNETIQETVAYDNLGNVRLIMISRNGRRRDVYICSGLFVNNISVYMTEGETKEILEITVKTMRGLHEFWIESSNVKGGKIVDYLTTVGVSFNLDVPARKRQESVNQWIRSESRNSVRIIVPVREGWYFNGENAKYFSAEKTWEGLRKKCKS